MKKFLKNCLVIGIDLVLFVVSIVIFVMGGLLNTMVSTTLVRALNPSGFMQTAFYYVLQKLPQYFVIAMAAYLSSLVSCLMLYFDKYLIGSADLDNPREALETTKTVVYACSIIGLLIICFFYTEDRSIYITDLASLKVFLMDGKLVQDLVDNASFWRNPETGEFNSLNKTIAELLSMIIEVGIFLFFFLFKPVRINKNKKTRLFI